MKIVTSYNSDPLCPDHLRWTAYDDHSYEGRETDKHGRGPTAEAAIDELMEMLRVYVSECVELFVFPVFINKFICYHRHFIGNTLAK